MKKTIKNAVRRLSGGRLNRYLTKHDNPFFGLLFTIARRRYQTDGLQFVYPGKLVSMGFRSRFFFDIYEAPERSMLKRYLLPDDKVLELGGCMGVISCLSNSLIDRARGAHVVVEANPDLVPVLFANRAINNSWFTVEFCCVAEGRYSTFYLHDLIVGGSSTRETKRDIRVVNRSLGELHEKHGEFNVLIMDIEGGEHSLIRSYADLLQDYRLIIVELHDFIIGPEKAEECRAVLRERGFRMIDVCEITEVWGRNGEEPLKP